jgi:hypothetical protein
VGLAEISRYTLGGGATLCVPGYGYFSWTGGAGGEKNRMFVPGLGIFEFVGEESLQTSHRPSFNSLHVVGLGVFERVAHLDRSFCDAVTFMLPSIGTFEFSSALRVDQIDLYESVSFLVPDDLVKPENFSPGDSNTSCVSTASSSVSLPLFDAPKSLRSSKPPRAFSRQPNASIKPPCRRKGSESKTIRCESGECEFYQESAKSRKTVGGPSRRPIPSRQVLLHELICGSCGIVLCKECMSATDPTHPCAEEKGSIKFGENFKKVWCKVSITFDSIFFFLIVSARNDIYISKESYTEFLSHSLRFWIS